MKEHFLCLFKVPGLIPGRARKQLYWRASLGLILLGGGGGQISGLIGEGSFISR